MTIRKHKLVGISNNKADQLNNPSFKSWLLRIPGTLNSKNNAEVKIIQKFDKNHIPKIDNSMLRQFRLYLADLDIKRKLKYSHIEGNRNNFYLKNIGSPNSIPKCYQWIEDKLLKTPIPDYRKLTIDLLLVPYFINLIKVNKNQTFCLVREYLLKCNKDVLNNKKIGIVLKD